MNIPFTGGCLCGAVRYECTEEPILMMKCHCRDCQHASGSAFAPALLVRSEAFRLTKGSLRYQLTANEKGGLHKRGFCAECGSRITGGESDKPTENVGVVAGSLDDPSQFKPAMEIFTSQAQPWDHLDPALPHFEKYPTF